MKKYVFAAALAVFFLATVGIEDHDEFCVGFSEGFKAEVGTEKDAPACPEQGNFTLGSTSHTEGLKAGEIAARVMIK